MAKRNEIAKAILATLGVVGVVTVAVLFPGVLPAMAEVFGLKKKYSQKQLQQSLAKLEKSKLISITDNVGKTIVRLTKLGKEKVLKFKFDDLRIQKQKHWDRKWRLVIFDVPKNLHINRTVFTKKLKEIGFKQFQKSVWVTPYPCEDEIDFLKEIYLIRPYVRIVTATAIDIQTDLIDQFALSS